MKVLLLATLTALSFLVAPATSAQNARLSDEECLKKTPGDWGANFGPEWHAHEAVFWGCRLGVSPETVKAWQQVSGLDGMIQDLFLKRIGRDEFAFMEEVQGSAHCYYIHALNRNADGWKEFTLPLSAPDSMENCTLACPAPKIRFRGADVFVDMPKISDPHEDMLTSCKRLAWSPVQFRWDGESFKRISKGASPQPKPN